MLLARWLPAAAITESYAVHEAALFRYSQRGMLAARWDEVAKSWLYDVMRVRELFVHRDARVTQPSGPSLGTLGETRLAGAGIARRADAREGRQGLSVRGASDDRAGARAASADTPSDHGESGYPASGGAARMTRAS